MKSLKEFITENLEESTIANVQESTEKQVDENNQGADQNSKLTEELTKEK